MKSNKNKILVLLAVGLTILNPTSSFAKKSKAQEESLNTACYMMDGKEVCEQVDTAPGQTHVAVQSDRIVFGRSDETQATMMLSGMPKAQSVHDRCYLACVAEIEQEGVSIFGYNLVDLKELGLVSVYGVYNKDKECVPAAMTKPGVKFGDFSALCERAFGDTAKVKKWHIYGDTFFYMLHVEPVIFTQNYGDGNDEAP